MRPCISLWASVRPSVGWSVGSLVTTFSDFKSGWKKLGNHPEWFLRDGQCQLFLLLSIFALPGRIMFVPNLFHCKMIFLLSLSNTLSKSLDILPICIFPAFMTWLSIKKWVSEKLRCVTDLNQSLFWTFVPMGGFHRHNLHKICWRWKIESSSIEFGQKILPFGFFKS